MSEFVRKTKHSICIVLFLWQKVGWKAGLERQFGSFLPLTSESAELPSGQLKLPNLPMKSTFAIGGGGGGGVTRPCTYLYLMFFQQSRRDS